MARRLTAQQIINEFTPGDYPGDVEDHEQLGNFWKQRLEQSRWSSSVMGGGLYEDIKAHGQKKPVVLNMETKEILDGHHRIAAMHHINPDQFVRYRSWRP